MILCENCKAEIKVTPVAGILSDRRLEILELVSQGLMDKEIAFKLGICTGTVKNHITGIKESLGAYTRVELVVRYLEEKWAQQLEEEK